MVQEAVVLTPRAQDGASKELSMKQRKKRRNIIPLQELLLEQFLIEAWTAHPSIERTTNPGYISGTL